MINIKPSAVLLDWDDHLIDSTEYYRICTEMAIERAIQQHGLTHPSLLYRERGNLKSSEYFLEYFGETGRKIIEDIREDILNDSTLPAPTLKPGARELLTFLEIHKIPYAIVSDTIQPRLENNANRTFKQNGLPVPVLVGTIPGEVRKKPEPDGIFKALEILSKREGREIIADGNVLFSGDLPNKDGLAAINAGINHVIIPTEKSGDVSGHTVFQSLEFLIASLSSTFNKILQRPNYFIRQPYNGIPLEETRVIAGERYYVESPTTDNPNESSLVLTDEEKVFHNKRWIAKRGKNLDGTGNYNAEEKMAAAFEVVEELLTEKMIEQIEEKSLAAATRKRATLGDNEKITIHLPHIGNSKNVLRVAFITKLVHALNEIFAKKYPGLNVEFKDGVTPGSPIFNVLSIAQSLKMEGKEAEENIQSLSGVDVNTSLTIRRSTGSISERIVKQALFEFINFNEGDLVILADDHVQAGSTFILLYQQLKQLGVDVVAITSLAVISESINLQPHKDLKTDMAQAIEFSLENFANEYPNAKIDSAKIKFEKSLDEALAKVGLSVETLSNREGLSIMAFVIDATIPQQREWFKNIMNKYGCDEKVPERVEDSLMVQAEKPAMTPVELLQQIDSLIPRFITRNI